MKLLKFQKKSTSLFKALTLLKYFSFHNFNFGFDKRIISLFQQMGVTSNPGLKPYPPWYALFASRVSSQRLKGPI
jgi:hypothetical protein